MALAEDSRLGGNLRDPRLRSEKKLMVFASEYREMVSDARAYGWDIQDGTFDWTRFSGHPQYRAGPPRRRLPAACWRARTSRSSTSARGLRARTRSRLPVVPRKSAKHILIAHLAATPFVPRWKMPHLGMVLGRPFPLERLPGSILIVRRRLYRLRIRLHPERAGGRGDAILPRCADPARFDGEARGLIADQMQEGGVDLHLGTNIVEMCPADAERPVGPAARGCAPVPNRGQAPRAARADRSGSGPPKTDGAQLRLGLFSPHGRAPQHPRHGRRRWACKIGRRGEIVVDESARPGRRSTRSAT